MNSKHQEIESGLEDTLSVQLDKSEAGRIFRDFEDKDCLKWCDSDFKERLESTIVDLHNCGVDLGEFLGSSRRVVYSAKWGGKDVVVKLSATASNRDQNKNEEATWREVKAAGDGAHFAEVYLADSNNWWVVQEKCVDVRRYDNSEETLSPEQLNLVEKYGIQEVELGRGQDGNTKFVDYGGFERA